MTFDASRSRRAWLRGLPAAAIGLGWPLRRGRAADTGVTASQIVVGQSITLQGGRNAYGVEVMAGVHACLEGVQRSGGIFGRRIVLRTLDDDNLPPRAEVNARRLVEDGAFVLFGSIEGGPSTAVMKAAVELGVPFIGPMAGSPGLRRPHQPLVYPVRAEHREEFRALMAHAQRIGLKRVALFHADSEVGREHLANVGKLAAELGMEFGGGQPFKGNIDDAALAEAADALARQRVDLVLNHGSAGIYGRLIRAARNDGGRGPRYWGVNSGSTPLAAALGPLAHGMVFAQIVPNPNSGKTALARDYRAALAQTQPAHKPSHGGLEGYMTARALVLALRAAGRDLTRESLRRALEQFEADLGGLALRWQRGHHAGTGFVDLALVGQDGRFVQ